MTEVLADDDCTSTGSEKPHEEPCEWVTNAGEEALLDVGPQEFDAGLE